MSPNLGIKLDTNLAGDSRQGLWNSNNNVLKQYIVLLQWFSMHWTYYAWKAYSLYN